MLIRIVDGYGPIGEVLLFTHLLAVLAAEVYVRRKLLACAVFIGEWM